MSIQTNDAGERLWDQFLEKWPIDSLESLTIDQYTKAGSQDSFTYWLESKTEPLGSIWGGSAFKFGIFHRGNDQTKESTRGRVFGTEYAWYEKYGATPEEAFARVRAELVKIARAASKCDLETVDSLAFGAAMKWKIAFLYQDRTTPCVLPIYKLEALQAAVGSKAKGGYPLLYAQLLADRKDKSLFDYAAELWKKSQEILGQKLNHEQALTFLQSRFKPTREPVEYVAGFVAANGRELALDRKGKDVKVFVEPGDWVNIVPELTLNRRYASNEPRKNSLDAHAPSLSAGNPADNLIVPTLSALSSLCDAYEETDVPLSREKGANYEPEDSKVTSSKVDISLNQILYGPPGTGKTYKTAERAVEICDGVRDLPRKQLMARYDELRKEGRISFVTFHQSYGYEDFVEGLRPESKDGQVAYRVRPGIFREICDAARRSKRVKPGLTGMPLKERTFYKMSLGTVGTSEGAQVFRECIENGYLLLGWGEDVDFSECKTLEDMRKKMEEERPDIVKPDSQIRFASIFKDELKQGDIVVASQGNKAFRAIGEVTGDYEFLEAPAASSFHQMRPVRWLAVFEGNHDVQEIYDRNFQQSTLYKLDHDGLNIDALDRLISGDLGGASQNFVLVIDEINRANISKVFGELITLLEPDKREGEENALVVKLPYSGDEFSVPDNLHVIGTMNTADRSIALLDTALRRRFDFEELQPVPEILGLVDGVDLSRMLKTLNERIEYLYDRDHTIGHAYFIDVGSLEDLERTFRRKIIPLLQEYFYEDWERVRLALNDKAGMFVEENTAIPSGLDSAADGFEAKPRYRVSEKKFPVDAFLNIYQ